MTLSKLDAGQAQIAIVGMGYVGLPLALAFAERWQVVGFDIDQDKISSLQQKRDPSNEIPASSFENRQITFSAQESALEDCSIYIVAVPTPVDDRKVPDLGPLLSATQLIGRFLSLGDMVIYESTVYPGCTEEDCVPILAASSGLTYKADFKVGYSPERINPGEQSRTVEKITKVISACDSKALNIIEELYREVLQGGVYAASSIKVAEAAKVIENTQRDLNISFVNELSMIFDNTYEVIEAAGTKWNFAKYYPGLVGGHCIGVDPYYLLFKARQLGHAPQVILSGRRINDGMPAYIAKRLVQMIIKKGRNPKNSKVLMLGVTFKENVSDVRNSKVADLVHELHQYSIQVDVSDPMASPSDVHRQHGLKLIEDIKGPYDAIIVAVAHRAYERYRMQDFEGWLNADVGILFDLKGLYTAQPTEKVTYWRL
ncbi:MAG: nucleotide sugar dehydrogenase [Bacteroidetes bacterium]|nr:nucleotide sugar dehydrogenase [Bacteroidota bacterium]